MGICLTRAASSTTTRRSNSSRRRGVVGAIVVFGEGEGEFLRIESGTKVQRVLRNYPDHLVFDSKSLAAGKIVKEMCVDEEVKGGEIYFLLPRTRLHSVLKKSDMRSLLAKANYAVLSMPNFSLKREKIRHYSCDDCCGLSNNRVPVLALSRSYSSPSKIMQRPAKWSSKLAPVTEVATS